MRIVGRSQDGKDVWRGAYALYQESGTPLSVILEGIYRRGLADVLGEIDDMNAHGVRNPCAKFLEALADTSASPELQDGIRERLHASL